MIKECGTMSKRLLLKTLLKAKDKGVSYFSVAIQVKDNPKPEVIIFGNENFENKLEYYDKTYDENLEHKHAENIKIVGYSTSNDFETIEKKLLK